MDTNLGFLEIPDNYLYLSEEEDGGFFLGGKGSEDSQMLFDFSDFLDTPSPAGSPLIHPKREQRRGAAAGAAEDLMHTADNFEEFMSEFTESDASSSSAATPFIFSDQNVSNEGVVSLLPPSPPPPPPSPREIGHIDLSKCFSLGRIDSVLLVQAMNKCTFNKESLAKACVNMVEVCNALVARD